MDQQPITMMSQPIIEETRLWLQKLVIDLNLCPFAATPFRADRIRYQVCSATDDDSLYQTLLQEMQLICDTPASNIETSLLIFPNDFESLEQLLDLADLTEQLIEQANMETLLQIASFHPAYQFADAPPDDPANYSNRSPYPMLHFIRADQLETAIQQHPDPDGIPQRNIALLREMGTAAIKALMNNQH